MHSALRASKDWIAAPLGLAMTEEKSVIAQGYSSAREGLEHGL